MAGANFNGLIKIYGEDVLNSIKGYEFHYQQSVERKVKSLGKKGKTFKLIASEILIALTPESYDVAVDRMLDFIASDLAVVGVYIHIFYK